MSTKRREGLSASQPRLFYYHAGCLAVCGRYTTRHQFFENLIAAHSKISRAVPEALPTAGTLIQDYCESSQAMSRYRRGKIGYYFKGHPEIPVR